MHVLPIYTAMGASVICFEWSNMCPTYLRRSHLSWLQLKEMESFNGHTHTHTCTHTNKHTTKTKETHTNQRSTQKSRHNTRQSTTDCGQVVQLGSKQNTWQSFPMAYTMLEKLLRFFWLIYIGFFLELCLPGHWNIVETKCDQVIFHG